MSNQHSGETNHKAVVKREVEQLLHDTPSFHQLDSATQAALRDSMTKISGYLSETASSPLASQLAPLDLQRRLAPQSRQQQPAAPVPGQPSPTPGQGAAGEGSAGQGQGTTGRVGEVARATLNAIDFPQFVASLIHGTFQAIVDSSIQQMEAYAELLKNVAKTVDQFMVDNISHGTARDYLADRYDGFLVRDTAEGKPKLRVNPDGLPNGEMPSFFRDLGFESPDDVDEKAVEEVAVPAARRSMAEQRQQTLATMVLMGINRVLVDDGEITAKLQFHIDAAETAKIRFDQTKTTSGNMSGRAGRNPFTANAIMVNTTSLNAQSDINVRADLTGQVKVRFKSESFPLERFADSAAIQLINQNAKVPAPQPATSNAPTTSVTPASPPAATPASPPALTSPQAPAAQPQIVQQVAASASFPEPVALSLEDIEAWAPKTKRGLGDGDDHRDHWEPLRS